MITIYYESIDGVRKRTVHSTIEKARAHAAYYVGESPTVSRLGCAVSDDGIGKVTCEGCRITDLFKE